MPKQPARTALTNAPTMPTPSRMQLNIISEVALSADGSARPIHILRTGTFTAGSGFTFTFESTHLATIAENFQAGKRKRPPITECHDYGRAVGRLDSVWTDATGENLYAQPKWNKEGAQLLIDEVYDGFSCEIDSLDSSPFLIGGSLTNYPAVNGLQAVTLAAPPPAVSLQTTPEETQAVDTQVLSLLAPLASVPARKNDTTTSTTKEKPMADEPTTNDGAPAISEEMRAQIAAQALANAGEQLTATQFEMMQAQFAQMQEAANRKAEQMFTRWQAEQEQRQKMTVWAQNATTATMQRQYALSCTADDLTNLLAETPAGPRAKWQALLDSTLANGFVSFEEIGSQGGDDPRDARQQYEALVDEKMKTGNLSRYEALKAVNKANPELYAQQTAAKKGGR
jgi:hypothetical protein